MYIIGVIQVHTRSSTNSSISSTTSSVELNVSRIGLHGSPLPMGLIASKWHLETCASSSHWLFLCDKIGKELERSFILLWCSSAAASVLGECFSHVDLPGL